jgi:alpha-glucosidase
MDDNEGYGYANGESCLMKFTVFGNRRQFRIICDAKGNYTKAGLNYKVVLHGLPFVPKSYEIDDKEVKVSSRHRSKEISFVAPQGFRKIRISH